MSLSNATEVDVLAWIAKGVDPAWRANATGYMALVSLLAPDEANPLASELTYTGYARIPVTKASAFTGTSPLTNANLLQFGKRTDAGATQTARAMVWCDTASGAINMALIAPLADELAINQNIQPQFEPATVTFTAE
jgi:hypothetical protein